MVVGSMTKTETASATGGALSMKPVATITWRIIDTSGETLFDNYINFS